MTSIKLIKNSGSSSNIKNDNGNNVIVKDSSSFAIGGADSCISSSSSSSSSNSNSSGIGRGRRSFRRKDRNKYDDEELNHVESGYFGDINLIFSTSDDASTTRMCSPDKDSSILYGVSTTSSSTLAVDHPTTISTSTTTRPEGSHPPPSTTLCTTTAQVSATAAAASDVVIGITATSPSSSKSLFPEQQEQPIADFPTISNDLSIDADAETFCNSNRMKRVGSATANSKLLPPRIHNVFVNQQQQQQQPQQQSLFFYDSDGEVSAGSNATLVFTTTTANNPHTTLSTSSSTNKHPPSTTTTITAAAARATTTMEYPQQPKRKYMPYLPYSFDTPTTKVSSTSTTNSHHERQSSWGSLTSTQTNNSLIFTAGGGTDELSSYDTMLLPPSNVDVPTTIITATTTTTTATSLSSSSPPIHVGDQATINAFKAATIAPPSLPSLSSSSSSMTSPFVTYNTSSILDTSTNFEPKEKHSYNIIQLEEIQDPIITLSSTEQHERNDTTQPSLEVPATESFQGMLTTITTTTPKGTPKNYNSNGNLGAMTTNNGFSQPIMPPRIRSVTPQKTSPSLLTRDNYGNKTKTLSINTNKKGITTPSSPKMTTTNARLTDLLSNEISHFLRLDSNRSVSSTSNTSDGDIAKEQQKQKFHERNQAFLKKQQQQQNFLPRGVTSSPLGAAVPSRTATTPNRTISSSSPAPPPSPSAMLLLTNHSFHSHRRLSSIDNDDWEDNGNEEGIEKDQDNVTKQLIVPASKIFRDATSSATVKKTLSSSFAPSSLNNNDNNKLDQLVPTDEKTFLLIPSLHDNTSKHIYGSAADSTIFLSSSSSACTSSPSHSACTASTTKVKKRSDKAWKQENKHARQIAKVRILTSYSCDPSLSTN